MLTTLQMQQALDNLELLIANHTISPVYFSLKNEQITKNWFLQSDHIRELENYLQNLIDEVSNKNADIDDPLFASLFISLQNFLHLHRNHIKAGLRLNLENSDYLKRKNLTMHRLGHVHRENQFKNDLRQGALPRIQYDMKTQHYTAPDDTKAHQHGPEAQRIFFSTQWERFKGLCHWLFAKIGIHVFETARYKEHDYVDADTYTNDPAIKPGINADQKASHYWIGHASNLITIPTKKSPLHVITDPVEGDLAPLIYPRMTKEGNLIDGTGSNKLPKIDVVMISHNHLDHVSHSTLKRLLKQQPKMIVPEGDESFFLNMGFTDVVGLKWWDQAKIVDEEGTELLRVTAVPARHWSGRSLTDAHCSAFNGYVMQSEQLAGDIYFAGDTALMDDEVSKPIFEKFNVVTSIQPGGPDERREDLESTHQSSADAIEMHFKILSAQYKKMKQKNEQLTLDEFLEKNHSLKTFYNHTATFKLGNLRLKDTYYSLQRMIAAFQESEQWRADHLPQHEIKVYNRVQSLVQEMAFHDDKRLDDAQIANLIQSSVVIPKIGQRQELYFTEQAGQPKSFQYRNLITNRRALIEYDALLQEYIAQPAEEFDAKQLILNLINSYQSPWYAYFSRTFHGVNSYKQDIADCDNTEDLLDVLNRMEMNLGQRNQHGHMQSLIHYAKWVVTFSAQNPEQAVVKFKEYFACQKVKALADQETHHENDTAKQQAFKILANQLAELPEEVEEYQSAVNTWLSTKANDAQTTQQMISENRSSLFAQKTPHSKATLIDIQKTLEL